MNAQAFVDIETGVAFTGYNDVAIPSDTGTKISLKDDTSSNYALALRIRAAYTLRLGYRVLEGCSDGGGNVYTFALFHYITAGVTVRF